MMNLLRRRALMIAAQQNTVPVWDGVTVTTPQLVGGYYQIKDGPTLMGYRVLPADGQYHKAKVIADFAMNDWNEYETWTETNGPNGRFRTVQSLTEFGEIDGQGHTIYGLYVQRTDYQMIVNANQTYTSLHNIRFDSCAFFKNAPLGYFWNAYNVVFSNTRHIGISYLDTSYGLLFSTLNGQPNIHSILFNGISTGYNQHGTVVGDSSTSSATLKNIGVIGSINDIDSNYYFGSIIGGNNAIKLSNCWESCNLTKPGSNARALAPPGTVFTNCYYDSSKLYRVAQGTAKTTTEMKSQAFVDLLNANLPAGCTPWKLGTDNYPTLDF